MSVWVEQDRIFVVPREQVLQAWPAIHDQLRRIQGEDWEPEDVLEELEQGYAQCWGIRGSPIQTLFITKICHTHTHRHGLVWICAGEHIESGLGMYREYIEPWFKTQRCEWIEIVGRAGWQKVLPDYQKRAVILRKVL